MRNTIRLGSAFALAFALTAMAADPPAENPAEKPAEKPKPKVMPIIRLRPVVKAVKAGEATPAPVAVAKAKPVGSHDQTRTIEIQGSSPNNKLQTLALAADGNVLALVAPPKQVTKPTPAMNTEVQVFDTGGRKVTAWPVNFLGQAINGGPDGTVYVAGNGRLATFDKSGKPLAEMELPHIAKLAGDQEKLKKQAEEQKQAEISSYEEMLKQFKDQKEAIEKKDQATLTDEEKAQLKSATVRVTSYERMIETKKKGSIDGIVDNLLSRMKIINAVAASDKDVFVVCGESKGYGFAVWRMDRDLKNPKQVLSNLSGCCGQMDVQASGDDLWVAENTKHAVGHYNRDGKKLGSFGKRGKDNEADCFGGCCNPMNVRVGPAGRIYTAESEGFVRCFEPDGKPLGVIGAAELKGGCKNVAVAVSADGNTVFFCDQPGSRIIVLTKKKSEAASGGN